ncbi:MAG: hypothetical protein LQ340_006603 [Diploschistes diacapsis]|nr:MAG: hypothetical protein LQ340_006603 [Diploschistes diacapsis]
MAYNKPASKWGSFFQQAVAGVESRLDTILAEDEQPSSSSKRFAEPTAGYGKDESRDRQLAQGRFRYQVSRSADNEISDAKGKGPPSKSTERLQDRLSKAMSGRIPAGSASNSNVSTPRTGTPFGNSTSQRTSSDNKRYIEEEEVKYSALQGDAHCITAISVESSDSDPYNISNHGISTEFAFRNSNFKPRVESSLAELSIGLATEVTYDAPTTSDPTGLDEYRELVQRLRGNLEVGEGARRSEANQLLEQIYSLQKKLQILTGQASAQAKHTKAAAGTNEFEGQLAERDEHIALLIEEGMRMSQKELKLLNAIKKLRARSAEEEKFRSHAVRGVVDLHNEVRVLKEKLKSSESSQQAEAQRAQSPAPTRSKLNFVSAELEAKDSHVSDPQQKITQSNCVGVVEEVEKWKCRLELEQATVAKLREELSTAELDRERLNDSHKSQLRDIETDRYRERVLSKANETDLKAELQVNCFLLLTIYWSDAYLCGPKVLERRLEAYRAHSEERSTKGSADIQAKLTRQIETLQSSYVVASENWRGIENSLLAKIAGFEKEQSELYKKESDLRRKAREGSNKCRELEMQLQRELCKAHGLEEACTKERENVLSLEASLATAEEQLYEVRSELKQIKESFKVLGERGDKERRGNTSERDSPVPRSATLEGPTAQSLRFTDNPSYGVSSPTVTYSERPISWRTPTQPSQNFLSQRQNSSASIPQAQRKEGFPVPPPIISENNEELLYSVSTPETPDRTINDMRSTSTAAAGPSVQLVERMSAAVRRLESEKAASRDEIDRLSSQRDEARTQAMALIDEIEGKRATETKFVEMGAEIQELNIRLQTTLEMLGEKSELVEELKADILDMKEIYRSTLEDTVK